MPFRAHSSARTKVILVEKDGLLRESLATALAHTQEIHLAGIFDHTRSAHKAMTSLTPDIAIVAVPEAEECDEVLALVNFAKDFPRVGIVFLVARASALPARLRECMHQPGTAARCFLRRKDITSLSTLLRVVEACAEGLMVCNPEFFTQNVGYRTPQPLHLHAGHEFRHLFSDRQREVLELMAQGLNNRSIADRLFVSERTVENHIYQIYHRLPDALKGPAYHQRVSTALCYLGISLPSAH